MERLLKALRTAHAAGRDVGEILDEIAGLLRDHPGLIRVLLDEVPGADPGFRGLLLHAVARSGDRRLRATLDAALAEVADPVRELLAAPPDRIAAAILEHGRAGERNDLVQGLSHDQLTDPLILAALHQAAESDPDAQVRRSALFRLGRSGDPRGRSKVLGILADPSRTERDRSTAALALGGGATKEDWTVFVEILRRPDESASVLALAANGLSQVVGRREVDDALFGRLENPDDDPKVRRSAGMALALGGQRLKGDARAAFEERAFGSLQTLEGQRGSEQLYAWSCSQFADSFGDEFRNRLQPAATTQSSVSATGE
jgi:hypothetical protein